MALDLKIRNVLISDSLDKCCEEILTRNGMTVKSQTKWTKDELLKEIPNYDALIVRSATKVTSDVIKAGKCLKLIGRAGTGVDNIDIPAATENGVIVMNTPSGNTLSAAEHTCILMASLSRHIPQAVASMREGKWERKKFMGNELFGKTLGIVGLGRIGLEVATRMQSFGMKTIGYDPLVSAETAAEFNVEWMQLEEIWPLVDYVTVHTPLIPQTKGLLNDKTFAICKKGVRVVNVARGGIIDEDALLRALESGHCAGAALDVFVTEPPTGTSSALVQHPNVISCPHLGASTDEAQKRVAKDIAEQIISATKGESLFGAINASALAGALKPENGPWLDLGVKLAKIASSFCRNKKIVKMGVTTVGASLKDVMPCVTASLLMGLIPSIGSTTNTANLINSQHFAKELGLKVENKHVESCSECQCDSCLAITVVCDDETSVKVIGTVLVPSRPVLLQVGNQGFPSPVVLVDKLFFFKTTDLSKVFGQIVEHSVAESCNIVEFHSACDGNAGVGVVKLGKDVDKNSKLFSVDEVVQLSF